MKFRPLSSQANLPQRYPLSKITAAKKTKTIVGERGATWEGRESQKEAMKTEASQGGGGEGGAISISLSSEGRSEGKGDQHTSRQNAHVPRNDALSLGFSRRAKRGKSRFLWLW